MQLPMSRQCLIASLSYGVAYYAFFGRTCTKHGEHCRLSWKQYRFVHPPGEINTPHATKPICILAAMGRFKGKILTIPLLHFKGNFEVFNPGIGANMGIDHAIAFLFMYHRCC